MGKQIAKEQIENNLLEIKVSLQVQEQLLAQLDDLLEFFTETHNKAIENYNAVVKKIGGVVNENHPLPPL